MSRIISAAPGPGAVNDVVRTKLQGDYKTNFNVWPGYELLFAVVTSWGRGHSSFLTSYKGQLSAAHIEQTSASIESTEKIEQILSNK